MTEYLRIQIMASHSKVWAGAVLITMVLLVALSGCTAFRKPTPLDRRVLVLDFRVTENIAETPKVHKGWWFGSRDVYQNPRAGELFADVLARRMRALEYVEQHSRDDLKYYMSQKRSLLADRFSGFGDADYEQMLLEISPIDYGADLNADYVITGRILEAYTSHHAVVQTWHSFVRAEVDLWDMASGQIVWTRVFTGKRWFFSQQEAMEEASVKAVTALDRSFFR